MTFTEIVQEIKDRLDLTSLEATARVGREVNLRYKRVTSAVGMITSRYTTVNATSTIGVQTLTFTGIEKVNCVRDLSVVPSGVILTEVTLEDIRAKAPGTGTAKQYAIELNGANTVTILMDTTVAVPFTLYADGLAQAAILSGTQTPAFAESFHDILIEGVMADELRKKEKMALAGIAEQTYDRRLSDLRMFIAVSYYKDLYAGKKQKEISPVDKLGS